MAQNTQTSPVPYSKSYAVDNLVFISGQIGLDDATGLLVTESFEAEARQVMKNIGIVLQQEGLDFSNLASVTIYLTDMNHYQITNQIYSSYFKEIFPARVCIAVAELPRKANIEIAATAFRNNTSTIANRQIVKRFLEEVRSGKFPEKSSLYMAATVKAHQMNAEEQTTVERTPQNYTEHVKEFLTQFGDYSFTITELIAEEDRVYARWLQQGRHIADIDGYPATGKPLTEIASCVYRFEKGKIVEYWIQIDRLGFEHQLKKNKAK